MAIYQVNFLFVAALLGCVAALQQTGGSSNYFRYSPLLTSSSFSKAITCGEVLNTTSGIISYKENQAFGPNERCVWTIRAWNSTSYSFGIFEMGFPVANNDHQITVTGLRKGQPAKHVVPTGPGIYNIDDVDMLIVTFHSGAAENTNGYTGFTMQYLGISNGNAEVISSKSKDVIVQARSISRINYPNIGNYANNELSTFVFVPENNIFNATNEKGFMYWQWGIESGDCLDSTSIYFFDVTKSPAEWTFQKRFCKEDDFKYIDHLDLVLAVFETDAEDVSFGINFISPYNCVP